MLWSKIVSVGYESVFIRLKYKALRHDTGGTDNGALTSLKSAGEQAERVFAVSRALYDEAAELRRRVRYNLRRKLAALQRLGDTALGAAEEHGKLNNNFKLLK